MCDKKENCEIEKLRLEIEHLRKRFFQQPSFWVSVIGVIVAVAGTIGQSIVTTIKTEQAKLDLMRVQRERDSLVYKRDTLTRDVAIFMARKHSLIHENDSLKADNAALVASRAKLASTVTSVLASAPAATISEPSRRRLETAVRASYSVAAYCYGIPAPSCARARAAVEQQGYSLIRGGPLQERPTWLAPRSTVLFYDGRAEADARKLASVLEATLQHPVDVSAGRGRGVSGDPRWSLRVHIVGVPPSA